MLHWEQINVDAHDPAALGAWWAAALGWAVVNADPAEFEIQPRPGATPGMLFAAVPERKSVKNRLHLDFRPDNQEAEVARLIDLGATRVDVGQHDVPWVVLADPEGNEFCVLGARSDR
jgi:predicted enzyme related to lactoylglutathione lyase